MRYEYIERALAAISQAMQDEGQILDWAMGHLHKMNSGDRAKLNQNLAFPNLGAEMKAANVQGDKELIGDYKRGSELMQYLAGTPVKSDCNDMNCRIDIRNQKRLGLKALPSGGYYFKASVWLFARDNEREAMANAWEEARLFLTVALRTANLAVAGAGPARDLCTKWFGASAPNDVAQNLRTIIHRMGTTLIGVCYCGTQVARNNGRKLKLKEWAEGNYVTPAFIWNEFGWSTASHLHHTIGFGSEFFNNHTRPILVRPHDTGKGDMVVTRGGAFVHEISHRLLNTADVKLPDSVYLLLGRDLPGKGERKEAYGPLGCHALAQAEPQLALRNADNYRQFCEDVFYAKPVR